MPTTSKIVEVEKKHQPGLAPCRPRRSEDAEDGEDAKHGLSGTVVYASIEVLHD